RLQRIASTGLSQVFDTDGQQTPGREAEITLGITWSGSHRVDLERAVCEDPNCQADHGYTGTMAPSDLALRVSALADGDDAVEAALRFHDELVDAVDALDT
ncbi:MAG: DUF5998 family protein, partial [Brachybacterium tyrofermentans]